MITSARIHYAKASIRHWRGERSSFKINLDIANPEGTLHKTTFRMSDRLRDYPISLEDAEDRAWHGHEITQSMWRDLRAEHGHSIKLWIGKLSHRGTPRRGEVQSVDRIPFATGLVMLNRDHNQLNLYMQLEDWQHHFVFSDIAGAEYNRISEWRNPETSSIGKRTRRLAL